MTPPTADDFRKAGLSADAINHPHTARGFRWLCAFNGATPEQAPPAWRYASSAHMQRYIDERAEREGYSTTS